MSKSLEINLATSNTCTGCGACSAACPKGCIAMREDKNGFVQPQIDFNVCLRCHRCENVCPILKEDATSALGGGQRGFAAKNKNLEERLISSSGGVFPVLARWVLQNGGLVVGVGYDANFEAEYKVIRDEACLLQIQGSKYIQCRPNRRVFNEIKNALDKGKWVLFSGLACQVEGLKHYLHAEYNQLICVDLICMGVPSPMAWRKYLHWKFKGESIECVNFKEKSIGWSQFCFYVKTNVQEYREIGSHNQYLQTMFKTYNMRESCFICPFKKQYRNADITIADCWGVSQQVGKLDDNKGLSSVVIHSTKGHALWTAIESELEYQEVSVEDIIKGNKNMVENKHKEVLGRWMFQMLLRFVPCWAFNVMGCFKRSILEKIVNKTKKIICKI